MTEAGGPPGEAADDDETDAVAGRRFYARWWFWTALAAVAGLGVLIGLEISGRANDDDSVTTAQAKFVDGQCSEVREIADDLDRYRFPFGFGGRAGDLSDEVDSCDDFEAALAGAASAWDEADCAGVLAAQREVEDGAWPFATSDHVAPEVGDLASRSELCTEFVDAAEASPASTKVAGLLEFYFTHEDTPLDPVGLATDTVAATAAEDLVGDELCAELETLLAIDPTTPNVEGIWTGCATDLAADADDASLLRTLATLEQLAELDGGTTIAEKAVANLAVGIGPEHKALLVTSAQNEALTESLAGVSSADTEFCEWLIDDDLRTEVDLLESCVTTLPDTGMPYARAVLTLADRQNGADRQLDTLVQVIGHPGLCAEPSLVSDILSFAPPPDFELPHVQACVHSGLDLGDRWLDHVLVLAEKFGDPWAIDTLNAARPASGTVLVNDGGNGVGVIRIENHSPTDDVVAVVGQPGTTLAVYLHAGGSHIFYGVPDGNYQLRWSSGRYWDPGTQTFRTLEAAVRSPGEILIQSTFFGDGSYEYSDYVVQLDTASDTSPGFDNFAGIPIDQAEILGGGV